MKKKKEKNCRFSVNVCSHFDTHMIYMRACVCIGYSYRKWDLYHTIIIDCALLSVCVGEGNGGRAEKALFIDINFVGMDQWNNNDTTKCGIIINEHRRYYQIMRACITLRETITMRMRSGSFICVQRFALFISDGQFDYMDSESSHVSAFFSGKTIWILLCLNMWQWLIYLQKQFGMTPILWMNECILVLFFV